MSAKEQQELPLGQIATLGELEDGQEADFFALMTTKEELKTKDGKPYFRVGFRDADREVNFPVWNDSALAEACRNDWTPGACYKLRATYRETNFGPQLDIRRIRETTADDATEGFSPAMFQPHSQFDAIESFNELLTIAEERIEDSGLRNLVVDLLNEHREKLLMWPAATRNHHAFVGGFLEHVVNVTRTCAWLAETYAQRYPEMKPPLNQSLVIAGGILHDIGKLRELRQNPGGSEYTPEGRLLGHILQGRDIVREAARGRELDEETVLRLEHIIVSHQRLPEWGSPKPPMTPEALLVHYADDIDAKYQMMYAALNAESGDGPMTSSRNPLQMPIYRGT